MKMSEESITVVAIFSMLFVLLPLVLSYFSYLELKEIKTMTPELACIATNDTPSKQSFCIQSLPNKGTNK